MADRTWIEQETAVTQCEWECVCLEVPASTLELHHSTSVTNLQKERQDEQTINKQNLMGKRSNHNHDYNEKRTPNQPRGSDSFSRLAG